MNHNDAMQLNACEKYLLGELSGELRDAFEDHYFSCAECAVQLRLAADFLGGSRQVFAEPDVSASAVQPHPLTAPAGWLAWLKPAVAIPVFAALLLLIGYQNLVTIPHYKQSAGARVLPMYSLISANTRGDEGRTFPVVPDQPFGVFVDVPVDPAYSIYLLRLETPSGASPLLRSLTAEEAQKTQVITINPGHQAGKYTIVVSGLANPAADASSAIELARLQFTVEFKN